MIPQNSVVLALELTTPEIWVSSLTRSPTRRAQFKLRFFPRLEVNLHDQSWYFFTADARIHLNYFRP